MDHPGAVRLLFKAYRIRRLALLLAADTLNFADRAILATVAERLRADLGLADGQIGFSRAWHLPRFTRL